MSSADMHCEGVLRHVRIAPQVRLLTRQPQELPLQPERALAQAGTTRTVRTQGQAHADEDGRVAENAVAHQATHQVTPDAGYRTGYEAGFEAGRVEGHKAGLEAGREAGREAARQENAQRSDALHEALAERVTRLDRLIAGMQEAIEKRLQAVEADLVELVHGTVCRILGEVTAGRSGIRALILQALAQFSSRTLQSIRVSLHDYTLLQADPVWREHAAGSALSEVQWLPDERVARGGCIIVTAEGSLDARLEVQLQQFRDVLLKVHGQTTSAVTSSTKHPVDDYAGSVQDA